MNSRALILTLAVLILGAASLPVLHSQPKTTDTTQRVRELYSCPMHPEVTSTKPETCSKCGMELVKKDEEQKSTAKDKVHEAQKLLLDAKKLLAREGKYNCCIEDPCNQCALDHTSCPCYESLKKGKPVCPECYGAWQRGEGKDKKIKPSSVKTEFSRHSH